MRKTHGKPSSNLEASLSNDTQEAPIPEVPFRKNPWKCLKENTRYIFAGEFKPVDGFGGHLVLATVCEENTTHIFSFTTLRTSIPDMDLRPHLPFTVKDGKVSQAYPQGF